MEKTEGTGERVGGYRVVRRLATGGTSDVLLAKDEGPPGFERLVVLKVLLAKYEQDSDVKALFAREAAAYARLAHPSIVRLYDFFASGDQLTLVLEYIDGPPLSRLRGMLKTVAQSLDDRAAFYIAASMFDALAAAHAATDDAGDAAPVIHRDVNPSNLLLSWDAHVKLADFGIAKVTGVSQHSRAGLLRGTYGYMAPEQVKGELVTARADVYSGAIILWELLTRRRAFIRGALPESEVLRALAQPRIASIDTLRPDLHKAVREAIQRALAPSPEKRSITAEEMLSTLRAVVSEGEGREQLGKALALVRHEPKSAQTSLPPPMSDLRDEQQTGKLFPEGLLPDRPLPLPPPRPVVGVPRKTAPYGAMPSGGTTPRPPVLAPPRPRSFEKEMPAATLSPEEVALVMEQGASAAGSSSPSPEEVGPSSVPGLASILEPSSRDTSSARAASRTGESLRLGMARADGTPGRALSDSIDDILRDVPSNIPPDIFPKTDPPGGLVPSAPPPVTNVRSFDPTRTLALGPPPALGQLPPAPPVLEPLRRDGSARDPNTTLLAATGPRPVPSSFPQSSRTLAMYERVDVINPTPAEVAAAEKATERPQPHIQQATTAPMAAVAPSSLNPSTERMVRSGSSPSVTLALHPASVGAAPRMPAPPPAPAHAPSSGSGAGFSPPPHAPARTSVVPSSRPVSVGPLREPIPHPATPGAAPRSSPMAAILVLSFLAVAAGGAATVGYLRWQKSRATAIVPAPPPAAPSNVPSAGSARAPVTAPAASAAAAPLEGTSTVAASGAPPPSASAAPPSTASAAPHSSASASASPLLNTPAPPVASASARPPASAASADDVPPGMGRVRTAGSAPGRRIFVDDRTVGQTPDAIVVKCGSRKVKLGSAGSTQIVDVPCGGEIAVGDR